MTGESARTSPPDPSTVSVPPVGADETTVRAAPVPAGRPRAVIVAVVLWAAVLVVGVVAQLLTAAAGGVTLTARASDETVRVTMLFGVGLFASLLPDVHWLIQTWAVVNLARGRGRRHPERVLTLLVVPSLAFDAATVSSVDRAVPATLSALHAAIVVAAMVAVWRPDVSTWLDPPVAFVSPGTSGAPAGLAAIPVPAADPRPARSLRALVGVGVVALVLLAGHTVLAIGGSTRASLEQEITGGIAEQATTPDGPVRCPWALGWDLALGATGRTSCTVVMSGRTLPVAVSSTARGAQWELG